MKKGDCLTDREREILLIARNGLSNKAIAEKLFISIGTVKKHFENIFFKLEARNKIEALNSMDSSKNTSKDVLSAKY